MTYDRYKTIRNMFIQEFKYNLIVEDLMCIMENHNLGKEIEDYMIQQFKEQFMYGELYDLFKQVLNINDLEDLLKYMGYDFIDLDNLEDKEKQKYY